LTAHGSAKRGQKAEDEAAMLQQIRVVNPDAAARFLEHLVLQKRRTVSPFLTDESPFYFMHDNPYRIQYFIRNLRSYASMKYFPSSLTT
jgi:hypothetical protein